MPFDNFLNNIHYVHDVISWKFLTFISFTTWCHTFMQFPTPLKERWCPHHILCFFCYLSVYCGILLWLFGHVPYLTHSPKMPLLDGILSTWLSIHVLAPLVALTWAWLPFQILVRYLSIRSSGGLNLCSWLGLEASWMTGFKSKTWNMGWTLWFFNSFNL